MKKIVFIVALFIFFICCKNSKSNHDTDDFIIKGDSVIIPEKNPILKKIKTEIVKQHQYSNNIISSGTIQAIPNNYAEISTPFSGRINRSFIRLGQNVSAGSPIFEILSSEYFSIQKEYVDALNDVKLAEKNYLRQQDLIRHGVGVQKELDEAEKDFKNKRTFLSNASSALKIFNNKTKSLGSPLIIRAPINGEIVFNKIVNGQYLKNDDDPVVIIAELSKVWISGDVKEKDIRFINTGDDVSIEVNAYPNQNITGKVYHIERLVDNTTRSVKVIIECDNPEKKLKPGMYTTIHFSTTPINTILIPVTSLIQKDNYQYVWVKTGKNQYSKRSILTSEIDQKMAKIISGLQPGDIIMTIGSIYMPN